MKNKILLLKIENDSVCNPLGLLYVGSYLKNNGYDIKLEIIHSGKFSDGSFCDRKAKEIENEKYLFVGFSVLTGPQTKYSAILSKKNKRVKQGSAYSLGRYPPFSYEGTDTKRRVCGYRCYR